MHFINIFLLPILALAVSLAFSAPILPNVDSLEARSIGASVDKRFIPDPAAAITLLQPHHHSLAINKRGIEAPLNFSPDGRDSPRFVIPQSPVKQAKLTNPTAVISNDKPRQLSRRETGSETTDGEKRERVLGRIVKLGKKLARLFYHPNHKVSSQAKQTTHRKAEGGDEDEAKDNDDD